MSLSSTVILTPRPVAPGRTYNLVTLLSIFCFLQIVPISAESQPIGAVVATASIVLGARILQGRRTLLFALTVLLTYFFIGLLRTLTEPMDVRDVIATLLALVAPLAVYAYCAGRTWMLAPTPVLWSLGLWTLIGLSQAFLPAVQRITGAEALLKALIPRYSPEDLSEWGRGVTLVAPEPAHSAPIIFLFFVLCFSLYRQHKIGRWTFLLCMAASTVMLLLNASGTALVITTVLFASLVVALFIRRPGVAAMAAVLVLLAGHLVLISSSESRPVLILQSIGNLIQENDSPGATLASMITDVSGGRIATVLTGYSNALSLGKGLGSWSIDFQVRANEIGLDLSQIWYFREQIDFANVKPSSMFALLIFDCGIFGFVTSWMLLRKMVEGTRFLSSHADLLFSVVLATSVVLLVLGGTLVSLPAYWLTAAISADHLRNNIRS